MTAPARARIDLRALQHNFGRVRAAAPGRRVLAVVKANAYGHGLARIARALPDADGFCVARLDEGIALREAGVRQRIVVFSGLFDGDEAAAFAEHRLDPVFHQPGQLEMLGGFRAARPVEAWLKVDSGMHRLGFPPDAAREAWGRLARAPGIAPGVRLMTHLANADDRRDRSTRRQMAAFAAAVDGLGAETSVANSAGVLGWPEAHGDWVRPGIMLYGISPFAGGAARDEDLHPVMTLTARLAAVNRMPKGGAVGYGGTWVCPEEMPVGAVAVGYGDGYPRHAPAGTPVLVGGETTPLVGRVSMDTITVDLRGRPDARPGDTVVLWGAGLPAEEIARHAGTIAYELVTRVTGRVEFDVVDAPGDPERSEHGTRHRG